MGFANPLGLLFASLYAVLIALYLWEHSRHVIDVPSLMLWKVVPEETIPTGRPRVDRLFVLQLLLLTLLIGALADPFLKLREAGTLPARHIFVLDISASMKSHEGTETRFESARQALQQRLQDLPEQDEAMLITAADRPRVVAAFTHQHSQLVGRLKAIEPVDTGTNLPIALAVAGSAAQRSDRVTSIEVFTDMRPSDLGTQWDRKVRLVEFGSSDDNVALQGLEVLQTRFQDYRDARLRATVRNFSHRDAHGFLNVDVDGEVVTREGFSLGPRADRTFIVESLPKPGGVRAVLDTDDALAVDNIAYAWLPPSRALEVLVVSHQSPFHAELDTIARATPHLRFHFMEPDEYTPGIEANADVVLFRGFVPDVEPLQPSLYVYPPRGNHLFRVLGDAEEVDILDWNDHHPVLQDLRPVTPNPLKHVELLDRPAWADTLLASRNQAREIPLAFAGERQDRRVACLAFDPADEQILSADNVPMLLFFLNLLDWLAPVEEDVSVVHTGDVATWTGLPAAPRHVKDPDGRSLVIPADPGSRAMNIEALHAGEYHIAVDGARHRMLANLFDPVESDIGRPAPQPERPPDPAANPSQAPRRSGGSAPWLLLIAVALLVLEWFTATRTGSAQERA
jgi:hypothetical protein